MKKSWLMLTAVFVAYAFFIGVRIGENKIKMEAMVPNTVDATAAEQATSEAYNPKTTRRFFKSYQELSAYVELYRTYEKSLPVVLIPDAAGLIDLYHPVDNPLYDCDDYSRDFVLKALDDGYIVYETLVRNGYIGLRRVTSVYGEHSGIMARAGNAFYYVEVSPGRNRWQITKITELD